jgi:Raf kinase inhibitor-like YbhB/YbcL family protein
MRQRTTSALALTLAVLLALATVGLAGCDGAANDTETTGPDAVETEGVSQEMDLNVTSAAFEEHGAIPARYANEGVEGGQNVSIPVAWSDTPEDAGSIAVVMVDRHPIANEWVHWMVVDIPPDADGLPEGASGADMPAGAAELQNTWGDPGYGGPQPPAGSGEHEYEILVYALDVASLDVAEDATFTDFLEAVRDHTLAAGSVAGFFSR